MSGGIKEDNKMSMSPMKRPGEEMALCHMKGRRPAARDGHTGMVFENHMIVFGGDRHHMPFNDCYVLDLQTEIQNLNLL